MALIASIGIEYVDGQARRTQAIKDAVDVAKEIPAPVSTKPKAKAKSKKEVE